MPEFDLPKFPEESQKYDEAMAELDRRTAENQAGAGNTADWVRQTWPAFVITGAVLVALAVFVFVLASADDVLVVLPGPLLIVFLLVCVFLAWRYYQHRPK